MYRIRRATEQDARQIHVVRNSAIRAVCRQSYSQEVIDRWTDGDEPSAAFVTVVGECFYVIECQGEVVASGAVDLSTGKLDAIFVAPEHMRRGCAATMLEFLEQLAYQAGLARLHLESTLNAVGFYMRQGYVKVREAKYQSPRGFELDCAVMEKRLMSTE
ncbi:GNAT family N-acetyltransferase [Paucibacter sp. APW11]|uniref:GNAT family N-acetyltransferase n=1 Tax=Roseateles aquae TaxID=3077235 RepID=A0ABU3PFK7_9BURK|nr:GNAT family N-acetyltransferase [Paucibacter sp. APW11]MDT9001371.1 GNAT family N-acetyltransferase [Paucibacter sp. APW11]